MEFVDIGRSFVRIDSDEEADFSIGQSLGRKYGGWYFWQDLLNYRRVVLLAEAGSGKTSEFQGRAALLRAGGHAAFFLRIEDIAVQRIEDTLSVMEAQAFEAWKANGLEGWLFLDSLDEARLSRKSFDSALKRLVRELGPACLARAHMLISCRVSDWRGADDRKAIEFHLPVPQSPSELEAIGNSDDALLDPLFKTTPTPKRRTDEERPNFDALLVVQIAPLNNAQRLKLAVASETPKADQFVSAIEQQGLDTLAERPGDLLDLAEYWKSYRGFGSLTHMTEHAVLRKLAESDRYRPDNDALALQKAREGAERLAAVLVLSKAITLRAPGTDPDPRLARGAVEPATALDDWTDAERNALLRRGLFAPSTYGRIRFHHRSTQEFLTAKWLDRLIQNGCPRKEAFRPFLASTYGVESLVPSLRPVAAWLALWHVDLREEILHREPFTLLRYGDPGSLPLEVKTRLLTTLAIRHASGDVSDDTVDGRSLWMFSSPEVAGAIRQAWGLNQSTDFRLILLRLIGEGALGQCVDLAKVVLFDKTASDHFRIVALDVVERCESWLGKMRLADK